MIDVDKIIALENGEMEFDEAVEFFQELIDSGDILRLQGGYQRTANSLIEQGYCNPPAQREEAAA